MQLPKTFLKLLQLMMILFLVQFFPLKLYFCQLWHFYQRKNILKQRRRMQTVLHGNLNTADHGIQHLKLRPFPVSCINNIPGRGRKIRILHIAVKHFLAFSIMFILPPVKFCYTPLCVLLFQKTFHAGILFFSVNVHKKFQHQIPVICKLPLKTPNTFNSFFIFCFRKLFLQNLFCCLLHPAGIQKSELSFFRNLLHVTIQKRLSLFLF